MKKLTLIEWLRQGSTTFALRLEENHCVKLMNGDSLKAVALLSDFGGKNGMLVFGDYGSMRDCFSELRDRGHGFTVMEAHRECYDFDPEEFIDILRDWGWSSSERPQPVWL